MKLIIVVADAYHTNNSHALTGGFINRKWQDYVYIQCEYKSTKQKIKHLLREENKVKENVNVNSGDFIPVYSAARPNTCIT